MANYNGWTNYATWKVNLEYFIDHVHNLDDEECKELAVISTMKEIHDMPMSKSDAPHEAHAKLRESLQEDIDTYIEEGTDDGIIAGWALSFLNDVNWVEIADSIITDARDRVKD